MTAGNATECRRGANRGQGARNKHPSTSAGLGSIVYSGVGKSAEELRLALSEDIGQINIESAEELATLSLATTVGRTARVALRVNPDVDAGTNEKITTAPARRH